MVSNLNTTTYLGHEVAATGHLKHSIVNLVGWCGNLQKAYLKPDQKIIILRTHLIPKLPYGLQTPAIEAQVLTAADRIIKAMLKKTLHLNVHTPDTAQHAAIRDGGLGIPQLRKVVPQIFLGRLRGISSTADEAPLTAVMISENTKKIVAQIHRLAGDIPAAQHWRERMTETSTLSGLETACEDTASREWVKSRPNGWTGRDYVKGVQLRTNNLPTKGIMSTRPNNGDVDLDARRSNPFLTSFKTALPLTGREYSR